MSEDGTRPMIVVGVDGSPASTQALIWAVRQAELTGSAVTAISAWHLPEAYAYGSRDYREDARLALEATIEATLTPDLRTRVSTQVVAGSPGHVLVEASERAELLVVGRHGHGGITAAILGSVSRHCAANATCPVVVVSAESH